MKMLAGVGAGGGGAKQVAPGAPPNEASAPEVGRLEDRLEDLRGRR